MTVKVSFIYKTNRPTITMSVLCMKYIFLRILGAEYIFEVKLDGYLGQFSLNTIFLFYY